jgi:NhaP-type Na+/H+ or K+/H+ antiporter
MISTRSVFFLLALAGLFHSCHAEVHEKPEALQVVLFMFFGIGVGIIFMQFLNYIGDPIPYTVAVFIAGILFSLANKDSTGTLLLDRMPELWRPSTILFCYAGVFGESVSMWIHIDAELLLFVFLPPLIFGEAMQLNWYQAKGALAQATILAGPGVLVGAVLMGCFVKGCQPNWNWYLAMTFGAITSATDPVAVVALLKSAGASPKLTMIIVGESLLNDGTAMVLFTVFFNLLNGETYTGGGIILFFLEACIGSVVVGVLIGLAAVRWLRTAKRPLSDQDVLTQTAITVCIAYVTFYVTQNTLMVSGVLGCCGAGIMLAWLAPPIILNHETMHNIWGTMEWMLNTMIFLLAGLIIGNRVFDYVRPLDWFLLVVLYVMLMIIRFIVIAGCYPFISKVGHKCTWQEAIFMGWGGLRGVSAYEKLHPTSCSWFVLAMR